MDTRGHKKGVPLTKAHKLALSRAKKLYYERKRVRETRMAGAVAYLKRYFDTYDQQLGYESYRDETLINDTLYGLGVALGGDEYSYADGFDRFKNRLFNELKRERERKERV